MTEQYTNDELATRYPEYSPYGADVTQVISEKISRAEVVICDWYHEEGTLRRCPIPISAAGKRLLERIIDGTAIPREDKPCRRVVLEQAFPGSSSYAERELNSADTISPSSELESLLDGL